MAKNDKKDLATIDSFERLPTLIREAPAGSDPFAMLEGQEADVRSLAGTDIERIVVLAQGKMISGLFMGPGKMVEVSDPTTGVVKPIGTWRIKVANMPGGGGIFALLMDADQLHRDFNGPSFRHPDGLYIQREVVVIRGGQNETRSGRRVTQWIVAPRATMGDGT